MDMCGLYSSCDTCTSSPDPVYGWCVLQGRCTRQSLCCSRFLDPSLPLLLPGRPTETAGQRMSCGSNNYTQDCGSPKNCLQRPIPMHFSYRMDRNPSCIELYMQLRAVNCNLTLEYAILLRHIFHFSGYYQEFICYYKGRIKVRKTLLFIRP